MPDHTTLVLLIRHGLTPTTGVKLPGRSRGLHLSDDGKRQADGLVKRLAAVTKLGAIYASPLERARETAAPLARERGRAVRVEPGLVELDVGDWTGLSLKQASHKPEWAAVQRHPSGFRFPGGESFVEMQGRITGALGRLVARHRGEVLVAVSHADPIKAAVAHALGTPLDLFQRIFIAPASVSAISYRRDGVGVLTVNSVDGDLAGLLGGR
ncbi:MAG: histidine phosphatase family protein [Candidatus Rokuibacteriota bacterium]